MKIGLIARGDRTGLGVQTYEFYRHLHPEVCVVDLTHLNGLTHSEASYPGALYVKDFENLATHARDFIESVDILFTCETPYDYRALQVARQANTKTIIQYNYELFDYFQEPHLPKPDLFAAPSLWNYGQVYYPNKIHLPVPINREVVPFRKRTRALNFLHVAGNPALQDRNGTQLVLNAMQYVQSPDIRLDVIAPPTQYISVPADPRIRVLPPTQHYWDLYADHDVMILPRKYGGLCLPMQEALSAGMPVIMPDISPQTEFLHRDMLMSMCSRGTVMAKVMVEYYECSSMTIANIIDRLAGSPEKVEELSLWADEWAESMSWPKLKPRYLEVFEELLAD